MYAPDAERTDAPTPEQSPSCGTFEAAEAMHAPDAHAVEPPTRETPTPDVVAAALREDRPAEYREKHALEVSS